MTRNAKSRNALDGEIKTLRQGLAIYKVKASPYYRVRIWLPSQKKRVVKSTKADNRAEAIVAAEELFASMGSRGSLAQTPSNRTFGHFADKLIVIEQTRGDKGDISARQSSVTKGYLANKTWGLLSHFGSRDVTTIEAKDVRNYLEWVHQQKSTLAPATLNHIMGAFAKVMKVALHEEVIDAIPTTPKAKRHDNPRPFFRFSPIVEKSQDEYVLLRKTTQQMIREKVMVRGTMITGELLDFILFMVNSFLRPTESEVYALTHRDIAVADNPTRLIITIRKGKTGYRVSNTMEHAVAIYQRIKKRNPESNADDYIFLPFYKNRSHAKRIVQRQFNAVLERAGLKQDRYSKSVHTVYSLRHTAICMRLVLSKGQVNIFNLAKNAGTSVDQIERFYAKNLPLSGAMVENLQSFGKD